MYPRTEYEMTQEDLDKILDAIKNTAPLIMIGGTVPPNRQEVTNAAWAELGKRMGFDYMTVRPSAGGDRFFSAVPSETPEQATARRAREAEEAKAKRRLELEEQRRKIDEELEHLRTT